METKKLEVEHDISFTFAATVLIACAILMGQCNLQSCSWHPEKSEESTQDSEKQ